MTDTNNNPATWKKAEWEQLFIEHSLLKCMRINDTDNQEHWSTLPAFSLNNGFDSRGLGAFEGFNWNIPNITGNYETKSTYSKIINSYYSSGYDVESASIGVPMIASGTVTHRSSHSHSGSFSSESFYVTSLFRVPHLALTLNQDKIQLLPEFVNKVSESIKAINQADKLFNLTTVLNDYGQYIATSLTLGGMLFSNASKVVTSESEASSFSESVSASFHADLSALDVPVSGGASGGTGSSSGSSSSSTHEKIKLSIEAIGGNAAYLTDYSKWAGSVDPSLQWHIIATNDLVPVINFLPEDLLIDVTAVLVNAGFDEYAKYGLSISNSGLGQNRGLG